VPRRSGSETITGRRREGVDIDGENRYLESMSEPAIKALSIPPQKLRVLLPPAVRSSKLEAIRAAVEKVASERERRIAQLAQMPSQKLSKSE
jgi:hypothetical protein